MLQEARRRVYSARDNPTPTQVAVLAAIEEDVSPSPDALDAGLASWAEGEQLYQPDEVVNAVGW